MSGMRARPRLVVAALVTGFVGLLAGVGIALGTPPSGSSTSSTLADVAVVNNVDIHGQVRLRTEGHIEVFQVSNAAEPGWLSGWHYHTGPVIVAVTAGALTFYHPDCNPTTVNAGEGFIESTGVPVLARNEGAHPAAWTTTQVIPFGASKRVDVTPGFCGL
jgi:hypothetical protein